MSLSKSFSRGFATLAMLAAGAVMATTATAQTTYNWLGTAGVTNQNWNPGTDARWDQAAGPGSLINGTGNVDDDVVVTNTLTTGTGAETVRIQGADVGTVNSLTIGGQTGTTGSDEARVQVRGNAGNINIGTLQLGTGGANTNPGQFLVNNGGSSATIGNVVSGSLDTNNRIVVGNNAAGGLTLNGDIDVTGTREIDVFLQMATGNESRFTLGTGGQLLSVDTFRVGSAFNSTNNAEWTLDGGNTVEANAVNVAEAGGNNMNTTQPMSISTFTVANATVATPGGNGQNGTISVGRANANKPEGSTSTGTLNVGAGGIVTASNAIVLGLVNTGANTNPAVPGVTDPNFQSEGNLNLTDAGAVVTVGRVRTDGTATQTNMTVGGINAGAGRAAVGNITITDGELNSFSRVYLGGDGNNQGIDRATSGTLTLEGGTVNLGADPNFTANGGTAGLNGELTWDGAVRDTMVELGDAPLEVGRGGTGVVNVNGGTLNLFRGNLVLGQSGDGNEPGVGAAAGANVVGLANVAFRDEKGGFLVSFDPADGDIELQDPMVPTGNWVLSAAGQAKVLPLITRGTLMQTGGTINVGSTQGADPNDMAEQLHAVNYNNGGGDITISGGTMNVEQNFNMGGVAPGQARNSLTVSGNGALNIGFDAGGGNLAGQASDITIVGGDTDVDVSGNLVLNGGGNGTDLTFDFDGMEITDFNFDIGGAANLNNAEIFLNDGPAAIGGNADTGVLASYFGDILLGDVATINGTFSNAAEGDVFGAYQFTYAFAGGGFGLVEATAIPEPSSLAALALGCVGLVGRRRRRNK